MVRPCRLGLLLILAMLLSACGAGRSARAQALDDEDEVEGPAMQQDFFIDESTFDSWVFGNSRNATNARARLDSMLELKLAELDRVARLTEAQKKKLELASRGDIKRFFDQVAVKRQTFDLVRRDRQKFGMFYQEIQPLQQALQRGLFGDGSLFAKTVKKSLDDGQAVAFDALNAQRRQFQRQARLGRLLVTLDHSVGLDQDQRQRLTKLIVEETRSPIRPSSYDLYCVLIQLAQLPEDRIKPIFHDSQWLAIHQLLAQSKAYKQIMRREGVLPGESPDEPWAVAIDPEAPKSASDGKKSD
ncbi:hypothetical protein SAMN05444166_5575 [Singulisphaera sp. GP187]|uniref:hypothetical protein n=1 Tax=Singulisphaera sp. GP187 TaxID=1882752 RepID=UPI00092BD973|nr:hypothetical protein [Singulisphaera sp. GP187]SIO58141.1 hypothetical protein SAMN05444166_5575 [Singulisphaera sp. GP187]